MQTFSNIFLIFSSFNKLVLTDFSSIIFPSESAVSVFIPNFNTTSYSLSCSIKYLESLAAEDEPVTELDIKTIEETIIDIINENSGDSSEMNTGEMRNRLVKRYPEFDVRNYGYTKFSSFLNTMSSLELKNNATMVKVKKSEYSIQQVYKTIIHLVSENKNKKINLGELNQKLMEKIPSFKVKDYGYSKFSKLIADIKELQLDGQNEVKMKKEK